MIKALILIGGKSRRMGRDKFLLDVNGKPQYQFVHDILSSLELPVYISCTAEQSVNLDSQYNTIIDQHDSIGPIGGIASAIRADKKSSWLVVACDLIALDAEAISALIEANNEKIYDITTYGNESDGFVETTCTIYNPGAFIVIKRKVRDEQYKLQELMRKCTVKTLDPPKNNALKNANTPNEL